MNQKRRITTAIIFISCAVFICTLFSYLYQMDNKYQSGPPYGEKGVFVIPETQSELMYLIDDWEFYAGKAYTPDDFKAGVDQPRYMFVGQYPNFSLADDSLSLYDQATYRMVIKNQGKQTVYTMEIPEIFTSYKLWMNGELMTNHRQDRVVSFLAKDSNEIVIQVQNDDHYYSGMTYPIVLGKATQIDRMLFQRDIFYAVMVIFAISVFLFAWSVWHKSKDRVFHLYGWIALFFAIHCMYPLMVRVVSPQLWYCVEDFSYMGMVLMMLMLCAHLTDSFTKPLFQRIIKPFAWLMCGLVIIIPLWVLPIFPSLIDAYGKLIDLYKILSSLILILYALLSIRSNKGGAYWVLAGGSVFGIGQLYNYFQNNLYEPIYGGWQTEYSAFLMVVFFFFYIIARNRAMVIQNEQLLNHLEESVEKRTVQLQTLVDERRHFFAEVAHDLKAPIASVQSFMELIQIHDVGIDDELNRYLQSIDQKNKEMQKRVTTLNEITRFDRLDDVSEHIDIKAFVIQLDVDYRPDMEALGLHFEISNASTAKIYASPRKLQMMFENLLYNAMSFTPMDGTIKVMIKDEDKGVIIIVEDTGCGVKAEDLPKLFDRFYSKRETGMSSGLGLYIVKEIVLELNGTIDVESIWQQGTRFIIKLPCHSIDQVR